MSPLPPLPPARNLLLIVLGVFLVNWVIQLLEFNLIHLAIIELTLLSIFRDELLPSKHKGSSPASAFDSEPAPEANPTTRAPAEDLAPLGGGVTTEHIAPTHPARPSGEFPTHETYGPLARKLQEDLLALVESSDEWSQLFANSDVKILTSKASENRYQFNFTLPNTPLTSFDLLSNINRRKEWDGLVDEISVIEQIDQNCCIYYLKSKAMFPVSPRDGVSFAFKTVLPDGRFLSVITGIEHPSYPPDPAGKVVRATTGVSGVICGPVPGNLKKTQVIQISDTDPKGRIPGSIRTSVLQSTIPKSVAKLAGLLKSSAPLDLVRKVSPGSARGGAQAAVDLAPIVQKLQEIEETLAAKRATPESPLERVRDALEWASPFMIGTIYFATLYQLFRPKK